MKKVFALLAIVLMIAVGILPSFAEALPLPTFPNQNISVSSVTYQDADYLVSIVTSMKNVGTLNSLRPIMIVWQSNTGNVVLYCCSNTYAPNPDLSGENVDFGNIGIYQFVLSPDGFRFAVYLPPGFSVLSARTIAYFSGTSSTPTINESYAFATGSADSTVTNIRNYWADYSARLSTDPQEAYNSGYTIGYSAGETAGYNRGYDEGYFWGEDAGYNNGYQAGVTASQPNIDRAYNEGYTTGREEGYTEGYNTGFREGATGSGLQLDVPEIFDGMFNGLRDVLGAFEIEIFGISIVGMIIAFVVIAVVAFVVRKLWK